MTHRANKTLTWTDAEAREALERYEGLVRAMARRLTPAASVGQALDLEDLCAEGRIAVLEALGTYEGFGIEEQTWVRTRVRQRMIDAVRRLDLRSRDEMRLAVRHSSGETTSSHEEERGRMVTARRLVSLDDSNDGEREPMRNRIRDSIAPRADEAADENTCNRRLLDALSQLPQRQRQAIEMNLFEGLALREIGERLGISESRVCQLQKRATQHLQRAILGTQEATAGAAA